jgi:N-acetyl sugar amidotransferase
MGQETTFCCRCVNPIYAVNLMIDDDGICSACRVSEQFQTIDEQRWLERRKRLEQVIKDVNFSSSASYDCVIPVSGGKDSYYQTHIAVKELGLKPLLVTYHANNYLPEGDLNRDRMREIFDVDHLVIGPSVKVLKKLNRLGFRKLGDMNWHAHCGIFTYPIQIAVKFGISLILWGETAWDISGMHDPDDLVEFSAQMRHEHALRGYEWHDFLNDPIDRLEKHDLSWAQYPSDEEILSIGLRGLYLGNYFPWDANKHTSDMIKLYDWKQSNRSFERTYRKISNLDDRYENGVHDLMKFIKFGYGRATDHASKDVRSGLMTRADAVEMVRKHDSAVSSDTYHWLNYVDMSEDEFWYVADSFREPSVWWIENDKWWKYDVWGGASSYGQVALDPSKRKRYERPID